MADTERKVHDISGRVEKEIEKKMVKHQIQD